MMEQDINIPLSILKHLKKVVVLYTDVDGTFVTGGCLLKNKTGFTLKNAQAIYDLLISGVDVVMTSGREKEKLKDTARILGFQNYIANLGIEIVYNQGEKVINNYGIDVASHQDLKSWIKKTGIITTILDKFSGQVTFYKPWSDILRTHFLLIGELDNNETEIFINKHFPKLRIIDNGVVPPYGDFKNPHAYHIVPQNVGKKSAVQIDKSERNLKTENLIGIGDSLEDVSIADEVAFFFLLDENVKSSRENVIYIPNKDGEGFSRIVSFLKNKDLL
jgi:HAD superfamily hydrolase (TIGR01484 family)